MNFKAPRRISTNKDGKNIYKGVNEDEMDTSSSDEDSSVEATQELTNEMDQEDSKEKIFRQECLDWLALNGKALLALETSKFLAKERKSTAAKPRTATLSKSGLLV